MNLNLNILKDSFVGFVRSHGMTRHFRRLAVLDMFKGSAVSKEVPPSLAQTLIAAAQADTANLLARLNSRTDGLTEAEADEIREQAGLNEVQHEKPLPYSSSGLF